MVLDGAFRNPRDMETEIMDEHMAAMVLTSLSCSPVSPVFPGSLIDKGMIFVRLELVLLVSQVVSRTSPSVGQ